MISNRLGHTAIKLFLGLSALTLGWSCSDDREVIDEPVVESDGMVNLVLSVGAPEESVPGQSRVISVEQPNDTIYFEEPTTKYEKMKTLRVIIISQIGDTIEHNKLFDLNPDGTTKYDNMEFKVRGNDLKTIYLFANEKGLKINGDNIQLENLKVGSSAAMASALDVMTVGTNQGVLIDNTGDTKTYIPMSEKYSNIEVKVKPQKPFEELRQTLPTLFVSRCAVKFSFSISPRVNESTPIDKNHTDNMYLKSITFDKIAEKEYILPHKTTYKPSWPLPSHYPYSGRFVLRYDIPSDAEHKNIVMTPPESPIDLSKYTEQPYQWAPEIYFCESKLPDTNISDTPYRLTVTVARLKRDDNGDPKRDEKGGLVYEDYTYPPVILPNLPTLPRNTHVKVNIKIDFFNAEVELVPYTGVWLDPIFGIDRD